MVKFFEIFKRFHNRHSNKLYAYAVGYMSDQILVAGL